MRSLGARLTPIVAFTVFLALWEAVVVVFHVNAAILPGPISILQAIVQRWWLLLGYTGHTFVEIVLGFALAVLTGIPLGAMIVFSPSARRALYPLLVASQMVPKVAIAPVFVVWFGVGLSSKVLVAFLIASFPIIVATGTGLAAVDTDTLTLFRSMGATRLRTFTMLRLPVALPSLFAGLKVAMSLAVVGAIVGEFVAANTGLGYYLLFENGQVDTVGVYAALFTLTALGVLLYFAIELLEHVFLPAALRKSTEELAATL